MARKVSCPVCPGTTCKQTQVSRRHTTFLYFFLTLWVIFGIIFCYFYVNLIFESILYQFFTFKAQDSAEIPMKIQKFLKGACASWRDPVRTEPLCAFNTVLARALFERFLEFSPLVNSFFV